MSIVQRLMQNLNAHQLNCCMVDPGQNNMWLDVCSGSFAASELIIKPMRVLEKFLIYFIQLHFTNYNSAVMRLKKLFATSTLPHHQVTSIY